MNILKKVSETIRHLNMLQNGDRVLIGVSGGQDSTALLHILNTLRESFCVDIAVIHINHCLRGAESDRDEHFVKETAKRLNIVCFTKRVEILALKTESRLSVQAAGRKARTAAFYEVASKNSFNKVAVGHTKSDQSETVLINLLRGTGVKGLAGIHPVYKNKIIRPLIGISRKGVSRYLTHENIPFVEDSSNAGTKYTRNRIRHELLPVLEQAYNRKIVDSLCNLSETCREDEELLRDISRKSFDNTLARKEEGLVALDTNRFASLPVSMKRRVLRLAIELVRGNLNGIGFEHISSLLKLISASKTGKKYIFPGNSECCMEYGNIVLSKSTVSTCKEYLYPLTENGISMIKEAQMSIKTRMLSGEELFGIKESETVKLFDIYGTSLQLSARNRREGDIFHPSGMRGSLKLKKFFINTKIPGRERDRIPLIVYGMEILWIPGFRRSSCYPVTKNSNSVLLISIE